MRISDWSSDVCSSDLLIEAVYDLQSGSYTSAYAANSQSEYHLYMKEVFAEILSNLNVDEVLDCGIGEATSWLRQGRDAVEMVRGFDVSLSRLSYADANLTSLGVSYALFRSEEHTSELQSLMRISYAVLCLKKKKTAN